MKTCEEMMTKNPVHCLPKDTPEKAARLMKEEDVGSLPVVEDEKKLRLVGVITDRDIAIQVVGQGAPPQSLSVDSIMTRAPVSCRGDNDIQKALDLMANHQVRRIPVVDADGGLVGMISQADVALRIKEPVKTWEVVKEVSKP